MNFALRRETVEKFEHRLLTREQTFVEADMEGRPEAGGRVVWNAPKHD